MELHEKVKNFLERNKALLLSSQTELGQMSQEVVSNFVDRLKTELDFMTNISTPRTAMEAWYRGQAFFPLLRLFLQTNANYRWWSTLNQCAAQPDSKDCQEVQAFARNNAGEDRTVLNLFRLDSSCLETPSDPACYEEWQEAAMLLQRQLQNFQVFFNEVAAETLPLYWQEQALSVSPGRGNAPATVDMVRTAFRATCERSVELVREWNTNFARNMERFVPGFLFSQGPRLRAELARMEQRQTALSEQLAQVQAQVGDVLAQRPQELPDVQVYFDSVWDLVRDLTNLMQTHQAAMEEFVKIQMEEKTKEMGRWQAQLNHVDEASSRLRSQLLSQQSILTGLEQSATQSQREVRQTLDQVRVLLDQVRRANTSTSEDLYGKIAALESADARRSTELTMIIRQVNDTEQRVRRFVSEEAERVQSQMEQGEEERAAELRSRLNQLETWRLQLQVPPDPAARLAELQSQLDELRKPQWRFDRAVTLMLSVMSLLTWVYTQWLAGEPMGEAMYYTA